MVYFGLLLDLFLNNLVINIHNLMNDSMPHRESQRHFFSIWLDSLLEKTTRKVEVTTHIFWYTDLAI